MPTPFLLDTSAGSSAGTIQWRIGFAAFESPVGITTKTFRADVYYGTEVMGSFFSPENILYAASSIPRTHVGTIRVVLTNLGYNNLSVPSYPRKTYDSGRKAPSEIVSIGTIEAFDRMILQFEETLGPGAERGGTFFLPQFATNVATLYLETNGRTYQDSAYTTLRCGLFGTRAISDSFSFTDTKTRYGRQAFQDNVPFSEAIRFSRRQYPVESFPITDEIGITSSRHGTITDWLFKPSYLMYFDDDNDGTYATTNWHGRIESFGAIRRDIEHWSGDIQVGNFSPTLADERNELWGSLFGSDDARMKSVMLSAQINDRPLTYTPQFAGKLLSSEWTNGRVTFELKDNILNLPDRTFIFDYRNIGSTNKQKSWGIVKKVVGTDVMFDDYGDKKFVQVKKKGKTLLQAFGGGIIGGVVGFIGGGPIGGAIGFSNGFISNRPTSDRITRSYYEVSDFDAIPDELVSSGQKIKFYRGSVSGLAQNSNGPLADAVERVIKNGTMRWGIEGTIGFETTEGIYVGDYMYVRVPINLSGSPKEVMEALLTGSNIDTPYKLATTTTTNPTNGGVPTYSIQSYTDFASSWNDELQPIELMNVGKVLELENTTPFDEIKELCHDLQLSFYVDEENKFAIRSIRPRGLIADSSIATYTEGLNIRSSGFSFRKSTEKALKGVTLFYANVGETGLYDGYNKKLQMAFDSAITGVTEWLEIKSNWIRNDDDAKVIAWRTRLGREQGVDEINLPTSLYGVINSVTDVVRVTHRMGSITNGLFEILGYSKQFDKSNVDFKAVSVTRTYGYGNCRWSGTFGVVDSTSLSGISCNGRKANSGVGTFGSLVTTLWANGTLLAAQDAGLVGIAHFSDQLYGNNVRLLAFGSLVDAYTEIFAGYSLQGGALIISQRGLFNTIPRTRYPNDIIYDLGPYTITNNGKISNAYVSGTTYSFGTTIGIPSNIGTSFRFF